ncbi:dehydrogenase/reductase SDR family member 11-like [Lineus longissimus]|uniref:dehydrogenase/reductase SDR family member 11-like n=1 Tax=Lineus longissimus TaxID=88925 RepID=UPI002B4C2DBA
MDRWRGRIALVTGASAGIGAAIASALVEAGLKVVGCGKDVERIQDLAVELKENVGALFGGSLLPLRCDVSKEDNILTMFETIKEMYGGVDICVNCAGFSHTDASLLEGNTQIWREMLEVNVLAYSIVAREAIKSMRIRGVRDGHLVYINSSDAHYTPRDPLWHFYSSTKAAIKCQVEGMRSHLRQLKIDNIRITAISPGLVKSVDDDDEVDNDDNPNHDHGLLECSDVSDAVVYALGTPSHVQVYDLILAGRNEDSFKNGDTDDSKA